MITLQKKREKSLKQNKLFEDLKKSLQTLETQEWRSEQRDDCPSSDIVLHTPYCVVFFVLVSLHSNIRKAHEKGKLRIVGYGFEGGVERPIPSREKVEAKLVAV